MKSVSSKLVNERYMRLAVLLGLVIACAAVAQPVAGASKSYISFSPRMAPIGAKRKSSPDSVTLSPCGRRLAVVVGNGWKSWLEIRDTATHRKMREFADTGPDGAVRWHPTKWRLLTTNWSANRPAYYIANLGTGKRRKLFRGVIHPYCWAKSGMLTPNEVVILNASTGRIIRSGNFGYRIPWKQPWDKAEVVRLSCGPGDRVAAEIWDWYAPHGGKGRPKRLEVYRKAPNRIKWVRIGRIDAKVQNGKEIWFPSNPNFLADGNLVYLRIRPDQDDRAEVWLSSPDGKRQRKVLTLTDLYSLVGNRSVDWFTIDRAGRTICYISGYRVNILRLSKPLSSN